MPVLPDRAKTVSGGLKRKRGTQQKAAGIDALRPAGLKN
jgi:hypothetical protein